MSEGRKNDQGKPMMSLVPVAPLIEVAKVLTFGAKKYDAYNWANGIKYSRLLDGIQRHTLDYTRGIDNDPETGLCHLAHAACGMLFLLEFQLHPSRYEAKFDDRYKPHIFLPTIDAAQEKE